ncbi:MAG: hypothetical protein NTX03_10090, partial [Bacteroidetes bacterium]|nr:hypothetical protein [Bacteroidota bacterium]
MRCLFAVAFLLVFIKVEAQKVIFRDLCTLPAELIEASGLATKNASSVWSHGDWGNPPELYLVDTTGTLLQTLKIKGTNSDWEDLTQDDNDNVYIGDFGNNNNRRKDVKIYIVKKISSIKSSSTAVDSILFSYPDQLQFPPKKNHLNFDCEAFLFFNDSLYLFTKNRSSPFNGVCKLYRLPAKAGNYKAELIDSF